VRVIQSDDDQCLLKRRRPGDGTFHRKGIVPSPRLQMFRIEGSWLLRRRHCVRDQVQSPVAGCFASVEQVSFAKERSQGRRDNVPAFESHR
jgi:hypothetical protein